MICLRDGRWLFFGWRMRHQRRRKPDLWLILKMELLGRLNDEKRRMIRCKQIGTRMLLGTINRTHTVPRCLDEEEGEDSLQARKIGTIMLLGVMVSGGTKWGELFDHW